MVSATTSVSEMKESLNDKSDIIHKLENAIADHKENHKVVVASSEETKRNFESQLNQLMVSKSALTQQLANLTSELKSAKKDTEMLLQSLNEKLTLHTKERV